MTFKVLLANPRGFCAGVYRAIEIVENALKKNGAPIYVKHEIVHNTLVVKNLRQQGVMFVNKIEEIPQKSTVVFSAHGISKEVWKEAKKRNLNIIDATCPLVKKVHSEVKQYLKKGFEIVLIGHEGHPEVIGTMGQAEQEDEKRIHLISTIEEIETLNLDNPNRVSYVSQTTLSIDETNKIADVLRAQFPNIQSPKKDDICYATQNRQHSLKKLASKCDVVFVVGSTNSSNANRLREISTLMGVSAYLVNGADEIKSEWIHGKCTIGVTAGASTPETIVQLVVQQLTKNKFNINIVELDGPKETVMFR